MSRLRIDGLRAPGVDAAELAVAAAECVALFGPSGGGKTRLLRAIADLDEAAGEVFLDDRPRSTFAAPAWRRRVMYLAADSAWWQPQVRDHASDWPAAQLAALGFGDDVLDWEVARLSSGERQRLALVRALARAPDVLLLDEPSANLDVPNTTRVERLIDDWRRSTGGSVLWVSHDPDQRQRVAARAFEIAAGRLRVRPDD
ncbi:MAG: ATP-binding cassette domain-containing protein [Gammaproteobacteria bacterium]|nr:ATP-binding cassette domain-containing protein [Gammaproteobacteria bacterium]